MNQLRLLFVSMVTLSLIETALIGQHPRLELNDVSWLWPVPETISDLDHTISIRSLNDRTGAPVLTDSQFQNVLDVVANDATEVDGHVVEFESEFSDKSVWMIAGMRIDPTAPGALPKLQAVHGNSPQIRLIIQPVTFNGSNVKVHDTAIHLVYSFCIPPDDPTQLPTPFFKIPDNDKFAEILDDIRWLKALSKAGGASTEDLPLSVHPGLAKRVPGLIDQIRRFLSNHLTSRNLSAIALMGIESGVEPWIFLALSPNSEGVFGPIPLDVPFAKPQMIDFLSSTGRVSPDPVVGNRTTDPAQLRGVATDALFGISSTDLRDFATIGKESDGNPIKDSEAKNADIADVVANPNMSNFFNTDCVSCHSESQRRSALGLPFGEFAFASGGEIPRLSDEVVSAAQWNVRNFGWFPDFFRHGKTIPTASQRTANETAEVLDFINKHFND